MNSPHGYFTLYRDDNGMLTFSPNERELKGYPFVRLIREDLDWLEAQGC